MIAIPSAIIAVGESPCGDETHADEGGQDDCSATTEPLGDVADYRAADAGACLHDNACAAGGGVAEFLLGEHEGGVAVLRGVGVDCVEKS